MRTGAKNLGPCLECGNTGSCYHKRLRYNIKHKGHRLEAMRWYGLKIRYGLSREMYEKMLTEQNNKCAICYRSRKLEVDHDHKTNVTRALLCSSCNLDMRIIDNIVHLERLQNYRKKYLN